MIQDSPCALLKTNPVRDSCCIIPVATAPGSVPTVRPAHCSPLTAHGFTNLCNLRNLWI